jgi:long-chain acyl-CoA synthetase
MVYYWEDVRTLYDLFKKRQSLTPNNRYLGWKASSGTPYQWITYNQANELIQQLGSAFLSFGMKPATEEYVGIFGKNRVEWVLTQQACEHYSLVNVPLYDTLGDEAISFILVQTQLKVVVCDNSDQAMNLMNNKSNIHTIVVIDGINDTVRGKADELKIKVLSFEEAKAIGRANLQKPVPPKTDDMTTICYTSGTTGTPKGAMITHKNFLGVASSVLKYLVRQNELELNL